MRRKEEKAYPYAEWEQKREIVKERMRKPEYVRLFLRSELRKEYLRKLIWRGEFARLINKSNRDVEELLELFEPLFGIKVTRR